MRTSHRPFRITASLSLALTLLLPAATLAAPSTHSTSHSVHLGGDLFSDEAVVFLAADVSDAFGVGADVQVWLPPDVNYLDPPTLVSGAVDLELGPMDSSLGGTIQLFWGSTGDPAGEAVVDAEFVPLGEPEIISNASSGNRKERTLQVIQPLAVSGTITVPGREATLTLPLDGAIASAMDSEEFTNAPSSTVQSLSYMGLLHWWEVDGVQIGILAESDRDFSFVEVAVILPDGSHLHGSLDGATFNSRRVDAELELFPGGQGLTATGGWASVHGSISVAERTSWVTRDGDDATRVTMLELQATGTLEVSLDDGTAYSLPLQGISGSFFSYRERYIDGGREG